MKTQIGLQNLFRGSWTFMSYSILEPNLKMSSSHYNNLVPYHKFPSTRWGLGMYVYGLEITYLLEDTQ